MATVPGAAGQSGAFVAEAVISFILMSVVLGVSNRAKLARFTPLTVGVLLAIYITVEAPLSGMSMNPARSLASALSASHYGALWLYFAAPLLGMLAAAELYLRVAGARRVHCAKLHHANAQPCIFRCSWDAAQ